MGTNQCLDTVNGPNSVMMQFVCDIDGTEGGDNVTPLNPAQFWKVEEVE
ncbi:MAG TPA: hypothetical protein VK607_21340 [Kofleriaceae bacterium]|nr:hypothetical protein [Kofleriaceae bacterium]